MTPHDFTITVTDTGHGTSIAVDGELDILTAPQLRAAFDRAIGQPGDVVADFAGVTFIDSIALHALLRTQATLAATGRVLRLEHPSDVVTRALGLTGLAERFEGVAPTELPPAVPHPPVGRG